MPRGAVASGSARTSSEPTACARAACSASSAVSDMNAAGLIHAAIGMPSEASGAVTVIGSAAVLPAGTTGTTTEKIVRSRLALVVAPPASPDASWNPGAIARLAVGTDIHRRTKYASWFPELP